MRNPNIMSVRDKKFAEILTANGIDPTWHQTGFGRRQALAIMAGQGLVSLSFDGEFVNLEQIVRIPDVTEIDFEAVTKKHGIYSEGNAPLARTAVYICRELNLDLTKGMVMEYFGQFGFTNPEDTMSVDQIITQLGVVTFDKTIKTKATKVKGKGRRRSKAKTKRFIDVVKSRRNILTSLYNLGQTKKVRCPGMVIACDIYAVGTETTTANQVATGDYYGTIHRIMINGKVLNVGYSKSQPTPSYKRSSLVLLNNGTPFFETTVKAIMAGADVAETFGVMNVVDQTKGLIVDQEGIAKLHWLLTTAVVKANQDVSEVAKKAYAIMQETGFTYDSVASAKIQKIVNTRDDSVKSEPVRELVIAGPNAPTQEWLQSSWTPENN